MEILIVVMIIVLMVGLSLALAPMLRPSYVDLAKAAESKGELEQAVEYYGKALEENPEDHPTRWSFANLLERMEKFDDQARQLNAILSHFDKTNYENELDALLKLARYYYNSKNLDEFYLVLRKILFFSPSHSESLFFLGVFAAASEILGRGAELLRKVIAAEPDNLDAMVYLALCEVFRGDREKGDYFLNRVLSLDPSNLHARFILACLTKESDPAKAFQYISGVIEGPREYEMRPRAQLIHGGLLLKRGNPKAAMETFLSAFDEGKDKTSDYLSDLYFGMAWTSMLLGDHVQADAWWQELVKINFNFMDLYAQFQQKTALSAEFIERKWNDRFELITCPSLPTFLKEFTAVKIKNLDSIYEDWELVKLNKGQPRKGKVDCHSLTEFRNLSFTQLLTFSKNIMDKMGLKVDREIDTKDGYDCITKRDLGGRIAYLQIRTWSSVISDVPVRELHNKMEKLGVDLGILVVAGDFTHKAMKLAMDLGITLVDKDELSALMFQEYRS